MLRAPTPAELNRRFTCEEYLDLIEQLDGKYELHDGRLFDYRAMAGASDKHALITANVIGELRQTVKGKPCRVYSSDLILRIPRTTNYRFGDAVVVCGPIEFDPEDKAKNKAVMNPRLIVEVTSPSTQREDHTKKFHEYQTIATFDEYVLIEQDVSYVQTRRRQADGSWTIGFAEGLDAKIELASLGVSLSLAEVYAGVEFPPPAAPSIDARPAEKD